MVTIAIVNQKGGVAKTTTCLNLAAQSSLRHKTLLVDLDKQANLSFNLDKENCKNTVKDLLLGNDYDVYNVRKNLDLIPSSIELTGIDQVLLQKVNFSIQLKKGLKKIQDDYAYCFIDCPPEIGVITANALAVADYVIIPLKADAFSLQGVDRMLDFITEIIEDDVNPDLSILGFVLTQYDERLKVSKMALEQIKKNEWDQALLNTIIRTNTTIGESHFAKKTVFEHAKNSTGARDYMALGKEILSKIKKVEDGRK